MSDDNPDSILGAQHTSNGARRGYSGVTPGAVILSWVVLTTCAFLVGVLVGVIL